MADVAALSDGRRLSTLRVTDLREELGKRGLPQKGNKPELTERLRVALSADSNGSKSETTIQEAAADGSPEKEAPQATQAVVSVQDLGEEEEEPLDYGGDSIIVSTHVEDDGADNLLMESSASMAEDTPVKKTTSASKEDMSATSADTPSAGASTTPGGRLSLRRTRDADSMSDNAAQSRKRRWGGGSSSTPSTLDEADGELPPKVARSASATDVTSPASSSGRSVRQRLGSARDAEDNASINSTSAEADHHIAHGSSGSGQLRRMEQEIALQEEAEQRRLKMLREQDALRRQQLLGKGTAEAGGAAATSGRSTSSDGRHNAAPGVARALSNSGSGSGSGNAAAAANLAIQDPIPRQGDASPPCQSSCCTLSIHGLVRPFTVPQLKQLLSRHGPLVDGGFWIDRIKSHCYVSFEDEESAAMCRTALHGARWPTSSPRLLSIDFANPKEAAVETNGQLAVRLADGSSATTTTSAVTAPSTATERSTAGTDRDRRPDRSRTDRRSELDDRRTDRDRERRSALDRLGHAAAPSQRARGESPVIGSKDRPHVIEVPDEEEVQPPVNVLDQLFRKTKTLPALYWLPLTEEQVDARDKARQAALRRSRSPPNRQH